MQGSGRTEDEELRSVALQNAAAIQLARRRAEHDLLAAKEQLRETSERLQLALEAGHLGDWSWDARTDAVSLSPRAADIFGLPHEAHVTWTAMHALLHEDDRERALRALGEVAASRSDYDIEYRARRPAGGECWVAAKGRATYAPDGTLRGMTGVVQDVTERRQLLESERAARTQAERVNAIKDEFLATLSHELRTPLSAILGWAQILRRGGRAESEVRQGLETIERNARVQTQLIEDLLDMSRIISGKLHLSMQSLEPVLFIEAALETVKPMADAKGVMLEKRLDASAGPITGDAGRLQQVVWNLLSNAIKFTPSGGRVEVMLERAGTHVGLSVTDTGIGIAAPFIPHVFERFRQADASTTRNYGGLGLGLSIVKDLVEMHGGTVHVHSAGEDQGATFQVRLPVAGARSVVVRATPQTASAVQAPVPEFDSADLSGVRVVIVDDDHDTRSLLTEVLGACGADVFTMGSAEEALGVLEHETADILVTDIGMPGIDGYALLRRVRELPGAARRIPAVALTAFARTEDRTRAMRAGFLAHVAKPIDPAELVATVASVTGRTGPAGD